jgi:hypothetical protein
MMLAGVVNTYAFLGAAGGVIAALGMIIKGGFVVSRLILSQIEATAQNTRAVGTLTKRMEALERSSRRMEGSAHRTEQAIKDLPGEN